MAAGSRANPRNLLTSLVLVFPLLIAYQVGILFTHNMVNGADLLTHFLFGTVGLTLKGYLIFTVAVTVGYVVALGILRRRQKFDRSVVVPVLVESVVWSLALGTMIVFVMTRVLGISPRLAASTLNDQGVFTRIVMSIGAGVWEETVFRLLLLSGLAAVFKALGMKRWLGLVLAFALSSLVFSAMHHIPPYGDPLRLGVFTFRALAGICFGLLFWLRGFAVAVYTHAFYDVYVLLIQ